MPIAKYMEYIISLDSSTLWEAIKSVVYVTPFISYIAFPRTVPSSSGADSGSYKMILG